MARQNQRNQEVTNDLGLGNKVTNGRGVNKDGSFNVVREGVPHFKPYELYHTVISMSWSKFMLGVLIYYVLVNLVFATIYYFIGMESLAGIAEQANEGERFMEAFFFSSQTLTTLGYGRIAPVGAMASTVAAIESMIGLLGFALATGLLYGRFSRPMAKILYSQHAVVAPYKDISGLMFRVVNQRSNQLIEVECDVTLSMLRPGQNIRTFLPLTLERRKINLFPLSWTLVHPLEEDSPIYGMTREDMIAHDLEIIILIKAFDDTFSQTIYSRSSYKAEEIVWGSKFLPMISRLENGATRLDIRLLDAMEKAPIPQPVKRLEKEVD